MNRWIGRQLDTQTNTQTDARVGGWFWTDRRQTLLSNVVFYAQSANTVISGR